MEFGVLLMKRGKKVRFDGFTLLNGRLMREIEEDWYKYLGILEVDLMREKEMKKRFAREYKRRLKLVMKSKLNGKNNINTWAVCTEERSRYYKMDKGRTKHIGKND